MPRRVVMAVAGATLFLLGACGGQPISSGVSNVPEAAGTGSASTVPELSLALPSGPRPAPANPGAVAGGNRLGTGAFCRDVAEQVSLLPSVLNEAGTPGKLPELIQRAKLANAKILRDAPAAIRADVQTLVGFSNRVFADATANPPKSQDLTAIVSDPKYQAAATNVGRYASLHCGTIIPPTTGP